MMIRFFTVSQVADMYAVSRHKVYDDIRRGFLPAHEVSGLIRVKEPDVRGYAKELTPPAKDAKSRR